MLHVEAAGVPVGYVDGRNVPSVCRTWIFSVPALYYSTGLYLGFYVV